MALSDRNILIVPNRGNTEVPVITFTGADVATTPQTINVKVYAANSGTLSFESDLAGQLFSISNEQEPVAYGVNDISGIPLFQVLESGQVNAAQYFGNVQIGATSADGTSKLQVQGVTKTESLSIIQYGEVIAANGAWVGPQSNLQGIQGVQGIQGGQGIQGVQGISVQGVQGIQGPSGSGGSGGTPGGTTNQVQYNSGGSFAGSANLTFNATAGNTFAVGTSVLVANSSSGNVGIGVATPAAKLETRGYIICGDVDATSGAKLIRGYYSSGALTTFGSSRSSGGPVIGHGVEPNTTIEVSTTGLISSTPAYISRSAYYLKGNTHYWFTGPEQTVSIGNPVTMYQKMILSNTGVTIYPGIIGPTNGLTVSGGDVTAARNATQGAIYLGTNGIAYLYYDGSNYRLNSAGVLIGGDSVIGNNTDNELKTRRLAGKAAATNAYDHLYLNYSSPDKNVYIGPGANIVWHAGNDGTGSGLDADLLDGINSTSFMRGDAAATNSVELRATANLVATANVVVSGNIISTGNVSISVNLAVGNVSISRNLSVGNVSITSNLAVGNITATGNVISTGLVFDTPIITTTTDQTYASNAAGKVIVVDSASARTITFSSAPISGFAVTVVRKNEGNVTISNTSAIVKLNTANYTTSNISTRYGAATVIYTATNEFILVGDIS